MQLVLKNLIQDTIERIKQVEYRNNYWIDFLVKNNLTLILLDDDKTTYCMAGFNEDIGFFITININNFDVTKDYMLIHELSHIETSLNTNITSFSNIDTYLSFQIEEEAKAYYEQFQYCLTRKDKNLSCFMTREKHELLSKEELSEKLFFKQTINRYRNEFSVGHISSIFNKDRIGYTNEFFNFDGMSLQINNKIAFLYSSRNCQVKY